MAYGLIATNLLLNKTENNKQSQMVQKRLDFDRLLEDIADYEMSNDEYDAAY